MSLNGIVKKYLILCEQYCYNTFHCEGSKADWSEDDENFMHGIEKYVDKIDETYSSDDYRRATTNLISSMRMHGKPIYVTQFPQIMRAVERYLDIS